MQNKESAGFKGIHLTLGKFLLVGLLNTAVGALIMLLLYNALGLGYWPSSAAAYLIGSIVSFVLNRNFTFQSAEPVMKTLPRFALNIAVCYVLAYSLAKPAMYWTLERVLHMERARIIENIAMMFGMVLFTGFNYVGQRYFTFRH